MSEKSIYSIKYKRHGYMCRILQSKNLPPTIKLFISSIYYDRPHSFGVRAVVGRI